MASAATATIIIPATAAAGAPTDGHERSRRLQNPVAAPVARFHRVSESTGASSSWASGSRRIGTAVAPLPSTVPRILYICADPVLFALAMELRPGAMAELNVGRARYDVLCGNGCLDRDETAIGTVSPAHAS